MLIEKQQLWNGNNEVFNDKSVDNKIVVFVQHVYVYTHIEILCNYKKWWHD